MNVAIWSRIPKTASTSLHNRLYGVHPPLKYDASFDMAQASKSVILTAGHKTPREMVESGLSEETLFNAFVFSVVRNPWARYVSMFCGIGSNHRWTNNFKKFLFQIIRKPTTTTEGGEIPLGIVQNEWLTYHGASVCDLVLKMEHIHKTYPNLAVILGMDDSPLGTYNVHTHRDYTDFYSDDAIRAVEEHEHLVIERFGYKFGEDLKKDMEAFSARKTDKT